LGDDGLDSKATFKMDVNWIHLAQDSVRWRASINTVNNLLGP